MQDALGSAVGAGGSSNWRGALSEAFSRRILALEALNLPPAVVRDGQHRRHLPALPSSALHPGSLPSSLPEPGSPPRKRKWTGTCSASEAMPGVFIRLLSLCHPFSISLHFRCCGKGLNPVAALSCMGDCAFLEVHTAIRLRCGAYLCKGAQKGRPR